MYARHVYAQYKHDDDAQLLALSDDTIINNARKNAAIYHLTFSFSYFLYLPTTSHSRNKPYNRNYRVHSFLFLLVLSYDSLFLFTHYIYLSLYPVLLMYICKRY